MKRIQIVRLEMVRERSVSYESKKINSPSDGVNILSSLIGNSDREVMAVMCLDTKNNVTSINIASVGTLNSSMVHPREIFKTAILSNSNAVIIAHNHPSGDPTPSREDIDVTRRIDDAGKLLGIELLDHLVIGEDDRYCSLKERGIL